MTVSAPKTGPRNHLLDPRFQLKYTGLLVGVACVLLATIGFVLGRSFDLAAEQANDAERVATTAQYRAEHALQDSRPGTGAFARAQDDLAYARAERARIARQRQRVAWLRHRWLDAFAGAALFFVVILAISGIVLTHRIAGPAVKLRRLVRSVGDGRLRVDERLRKDDELKDLFAAVTDMVAALRADQAREVAELDAAIQAVAEAGAPESALEPLRALRARMRAVLDDAG